MARKRPRKAKTQSHTVPKPNFDEISTAGRKADVFKPYLLNSMVTKNPDQILDKKGRGDFEIYNKLLEDDQVRSVFQQRRLSLIAKDTEVIPATDSGLDVEAAKFIDDQLKAIDWDEITVKMLAGVFYGYAVSECMFRQDGARVVLDSIRVRDAGRFVYDYDCNLRLLTRDEPRNGIVMPERKFWTFNSGSDTSDNPYGVGLAKSIFWPVFFKRNDIKYWLVHLEKFGSPTAMAQYPRGATPTEKNAIMDALDALQTDASIGVPDGTLIELLEAKRGGTADYATLYHTMDKAISKVILSQTMTTDDGSSLSQAQVHGDVKDDVIKADADLICNSFNRQVVKWLMDWNFPAAGIPTVTRRTEDAPDTAQIAIRDKVITEMGFKPTQEYITRVYGEGFVENKDPTPTSGFPPSASTDYSESDSLLYRMLQHRKDQNDIRLAATEFSQQYDEIIGGHVDEILSLAESTGDLETLKIRLDDLFENQPQDGAIEAATRAGVVGRLMGLFRGQR